MRRTTISIPEDLRSRAERIAGQRGVSLAEVVRGALASYLDGPSAWDPPRSIGIGDSRGSARGRDLGDVPAEAYGHGPG